MHRLCVIPTCRHYALHMVYTPGRKSRVFACHYHTERAIAELRKVVPWWSRIVVHTSSAVVVGDVRDWRTRELHAYDVLRQIGA